MIQDKVKNLKQSVRCNVISEGNFDHRKCGFATDRLRLLFQGSLLIMERIPLFVKVENPFCSIKNNLYVIFSKYTSFCLE